MKYAIVFLISFLLLNNSTKATISEETANGSSDDNPISIYCSPDLYKLTTIWANEYCKLSPGTEIKVIVATQKANGKYNMENGLGFISGDYPDMLNGKMWKMVVGRDIAIPVFNNKNPLSKEIYRKGISLEDLSGLLNGRKKWGDLLHTSNDTPVTLYVDENLLANNEFPGLAAVKNKAVKAVRVTGLENMIESVGKDLNAIGICSITDFVVYGNSNSTQKISFLPIDKNGNGNIDYMENIYKDPDDLIRGAWIGKYPKELITSIYAVSSDKPVSKAEVTFLKWILTGGQEYEAISGFSSLLMTERNSKIAGLTESATGVIISGKNYASPDRSLLVLFITAIIILITYLVVSRFTTKDTVAVSVAPESYRIFDDSYINIPAGLFFDKAHTWAFMEPDGMVKVGIDDFLQHVTGPITSLKTKKAGEKIFKGKPVLSIINNGKQLNLYSPISGTIREFNNELNLNTRIMNSSPYSEGWVYRIEPSKWLKEIDFLIIGNKYKEWLKTEFVRLKEFLSNTLKHESVEFAGVMQDGGELKEGVLADLSPEIWEDFQTNFIDQTR